MVEVKITYETLFDFLRREKNRSELQPLEKTFYKNVVEYLREKKSTLKEEDHHAALFSRTEQEKIRIQIKNIHKILRELYELREKKVINLAMNKVRTESNLVDTSNLLPEEITLFNESCELMKKFKEGVLHKVLQLDTPYLENTSTTDYTKQDSSMQEQAPTSEQQKESLFDEYKKRLDAARERSEDGNPSTTLRKSEGSSIEKMIRVRILNDLPKFMGQDKNIYGPFKKEDLTELPESVVSILAKKSRVEII